MTVSDINSQQVKSALYDLAPDIVLVFGTRLISSQLFESCSAKFINMHWGWSPDYRGEGIISALAIQGRDAVGVTVHLISSKIDGGNILYRSRPKIDSSDNFYSIGLKLTILGSELFVKVIEKYKECGELVGEPQDLALVSCQLYNVVNNVVYYLHNQSGRIGYEEIRRDTCRRRTRSSW